MRKIVLVLLLSLLLIAAPLASAQTQTYHNTDPPLTVNIPDGWKIASSNPDPSHGSAVMASQGGGGTATISWNKGYSLIQTESRVESQFSASGSMQALNSSDITMNGGQDYDRQVSYTITAAGGTQNAIGIYGENGGYGYSIVIEGGSQAAVSSAYGTIAPSFQFAGGGSGADSSNISGLFTKIMELIVVMTGLILLSMEAQRIMGRFGVGTKKKEKKDKR